MSVSKVVFSSKRADWETPDELFWRLAKQWGPFSVDAAATKDNALCKAFFSPENDGLSQSWGPPGTRVWVNPPYGRGTVGKWVQKAFEESRKGVRVVMLLPARTDQGWFHDVVLPFAFKVEYLRGRVRFRGASSGAPFPSMVVVFEPPVGG